MFDAGPNKHDNIAWIIALAEISTAGNIKNIVREGEQVCLVDDDDDVDSRRRMAWTIPKTS